MTQVPEDKWAAVYPGDKFPEGAVRAMNRGLDCGETGASDSYVALWIRDDGVAVFGKAVNLDGKAEAYFPYDGKVTKGSETKGYRILLYIGSEQKNGFRYCWKQAATAPADKIVFIGESNSAVVTCAESCKEQLGKANYHKKTAWTVCGDEEKFHSGTEFDNCYILCKCTHVATETASH